jgi:hypothetical protein
MWCYVDFVLVPYQTTQAAITGTPRGNLSDLYPRWLGARELLLHGRDPYSRDVTTEIQTGYYGRPLDPNRRADPKDEQGFAYPVYIVFLLAPTVWLPFSAVRIGFRWLLIGLTIISIPLWFKALNQRIPRWTLMIWIVLVLGSFPAVQGIKLQQLTLLVCALLAGAFAALSAGYLVLAGVLLALATIKPQLVGIILVWLLIWVTGDWRARRRLFRGFTVSMVLLLAASNYILPGWISRFRSAAAAYLQYTGGGKSVLDVVLAPAVGKWVGSAIIAVTLFLVWRLRRAPANSSQFAVALSLVMAATLAVIPTYAPYNQLLLIPALVVVVGGTPALTRRARLVRSFILIAALSILWPWITAAMLDLALLFYPPERVQRAWAVPLFTSLLIPLLVFGLTCVSAFETLRNRPA